MRDYYYFEKINMLDKNSTEYKILNDRIINVDEYNNL